MDERNVDSSRRGGLSRVRLAIVLSLAWALRQAAAGTPAISAPIVVTAQSPESAAALIDEAGTAHVIIVSRHPRSLEHLSFARDGRVEREVIEAQPPSGKPSAAYNGDGQLHVAIGGRIYASTQGQWAPLNGAPPCDSLVRAGTDLACGFVIKSTAEGTHGHWLFGIIGGAEGCCLPFAWYSRNYKLVIAREAASGEWHWTVLDGRADRGVDHYMLAGSQDGAVHALYSTSTASSVPGLQGEGTFYTRVPVSPRGAPSGVTTQQATKDEPKYAEASGQPLGDWLARDAGGAGHSCIAVDWPTGTATLLVGGEAPYLTDRSNLAVPATDLLGLRCGWRSNFSMDAADHWLTTYVHDPRSSPWQSLAYYDLCYRARNGSGWSRSVGLGRVSTKSASTSITGMAVALDSFGRTTLLASNSAGLALALWVQPEGQLIARWIDSTSATAGDASNSRDPGADDEVSAHCEAAAHAAAGAMNSDRRAQASVDVPISSEAARSLLAPDERVEQVLSDVIWYGDAKGLVAQAEKLTHGQAPVGTVIVGDKATLFSSVAINSNDSGVPDSSRTTVRIAYTDIGEVLNEHAWAIHWVRVHTKDGQDHSFAIYFPGTTKVDADATQKLGELLKSKVPAATNVTAP